MAVAGAPTTSAPVEGLRASEEPNEALGGEYKPTPWYEVGEVSVCVSETLTHEIDASCAALLFDVEDVEELEVEEWDEVFEIDALSVGSNNPIVSAYTPTLPAWLLFMPTTSVCAFCWFCKDRESANELPKRRYFCCTGASSTACCEKKKFEEVVDAKRKTAPTP